jgi:hypothetical protein
MATALKSHHQWKCIKYFYLTSLTNEGLPTPMNTNFNADATVSPVLSAFGNRSQPHSSPQQHAPLFKGQTMRESNKKQDEDPAGVPGLSKYQ